MLSRDDDGSNDASSTPRSLKTRSESRKTGGNREDLTDILEKYTKRAVVQFGELAMKAAAAVTSSLAGKHAREAHHRGRDDWSSEDNY